MVVLGEQVRIELFAEVAVVVHFAVGVFIAVGRRVVVAYVVFVGALVAHAARERKSVDDLVFDRSAEFVAVAFDDGAFAVEQPVGVAVGLVGGSHPVLDVGVELAVVGLEVAFVAVPVAAARESVGADERVEDETAGRLVRDVLVHVFGVEIDLDVVVEKVETDFGVERVLRVVVFRGDAAGCYVAVGEVGSQVFGAAVDRDRVVGRPARTEELLGVIGSLRREFVAPTVLAVRPVCVLEFGQRERGVNGRVARYVHRQTPCHGRFGRDHDGAVGGYRTVEGGGRRAFQQGDRGDVVGVDRRHGVAAVALGAPVAVDLIGRDVHHQGDAVDDDQRLVRAVDRLVTAEEYFRRSARARRVRGNLQTGGLALQRVDHIDRLDVGHVIAADRFGSIGECFRLTFDTHGSHYDCVQLVGGRRHQDVQCRLTCVGHLVGVVSYVGYLQYVAGLQPFQTEFAVHVGCRSARRVLHNHRCSEKRPGVVFDQAFKGAAPPLLRVGTQSGSRRNEAKGRHQSKADEKCSVG